MGIFGSKQRNELSVSDKFMNNILSTKDPVFLANVFYDLYLKKNIEKDKEKILKQAKQGIYKKQYTLFFDTLRERPVYQILRIIAGTHQFHNILEDRITTTLNLDLKCKIVVCDPKINIHVLVIQKF